MVFYRCASVEVASLSRQQAEIIPRHSAAPIMHNYMGQVTDSDHFATGVDLDLASRYPFAHGAEAICYFRWRQAAYVQEQMHAGLLRPDPLAAPAHNEAARATLELTLVPDVSNVRAEATLVADCASAWAWRHSRRGVISAISALRLRPIAPCAGWA
ncbi:beta-galactosidase [Cypionkella psychrotolerans]|uniref:beta-galactosidase n=1 Tax=Cypionkella psychrotolerans TaxID=1678131 RepID=UPI001F4071E0|nr:beta-galactosidase [Cypionkella psychrotolerans]